MTMTKLVRNLSSERKQVLTPEEVLEHLKMIWVATNATNLPDEYEPMVVRKLESLIIQRYKEQIKAWVSKEYGDGYSYIFKDELLTFLEEE